MAASNPMRLLIDFGQGDPLTLRLKLPLGPVSVGDLLWAVFAVADAIHKRTALDLAAMGKTIGCGPGCSRCCHQLVPVSDHEAAHLAGLVRAMPEPLRRRVISRFALATNTLDQAGLITPLTGHFSTGASDAAAFRDLARRYWRLGIPCPFLEKDCCLVHPNRPMACRQYLVTSPPELCAALHTPEQNHELVLHPVDAGGALAAFSGEGLRHSRVLPLTFSLLAERAIRSEPALTLPAPVMLGRFLTLMTDCFTRRDPPLPGSDISMRD
ncbi:YkgJ family cysteine cluster protein [Pseudodesulfovibrio sp. F-1]|uniref:YkgJ family cysteine cluster protein n=2 Tax=Pseudodesulfovibrio alkaliphilus TaxID=2661613 RepID=A0A7K1KJV7_9BACT|nr:YkgJ family cysteine cluster protein [Pseudodesulfovibrio alkaliphilus]